MAYLARDDRVARRRDPALVLPYARAVVMTSLFYWPGRDGFPAEHAVPRPAAAAAAAAAGLARLVRPPPRAAARGVVSSYAWGADYHALLEERLRALGEFLHERAGGIGRYYVDTGAVLERDFAERAGLGFVGKNSLVINPRAGSGFFIGALFTTVPLPADGDEDILPSAPRKRGRPGCGKCTKCKVACPTGAIIEDRVIDARKCISYLTIELKTTIPESLREQMGTRIYGCDICQQVCPWNAFDWDASKQTGAASVSKGPVTENVKGGYSPLFGHVSQNITTPRLVLLLWSTKKAFKKRFRGTAVQRIGRDRMARNAAVALGNSGGEKEIAAVGAAAIAHPSPLVREHAAWALARIRSRISR